MTPCLSSLRVFTRKCIFIFLFKNLFLYDKKKRNLSRRVYRQNLLTKVYSVNLVLVVNSYIFTQYCLFVLKDCLDYRKMGLLWPSGVTLTPDTEFVSFKSLSAPFSKQIFFNGLFLPNLISRITKIKVIGHFQHLYV